jgi:hypothetical protein
MTTGWPRTKSPLPGPPRLTRTGPQGFEPSAKTLGKTPTEAGGGAKSDANDAPCPNPSPPTIDPDLAAVVAIWPKLPEHAKATILGIVQALPGDGGTAGKK